MGLEETPQEGKRGRQLATRAALEPGAALAVEAREPPSSGLGAGRSESAPPAY